jgi:hypothetical protein
LRERLLKVEGHINAAERKLWRDTARGFWSGRQLEAPLLLCEPVLTEAMYLLSPSSCLEQPQHLVLSEIELVEIGGKLPP